MSNLTQQKCVPCEGGIPPLGQTRAEELLKQVPGWAVVEEEGHLQIERKFKFEDFKASLDFVNKVGAIAESEGHHPDIEFGWGYVKIALWTHAINGLFTNDFIIAAKINEI